MTAKETFDSYLSDGKIELAYLDTEKTKPLEIDGIKFYTWTEKGEYFPQYRIIEMQSVMNDFANYGLNGDGFTSYMQRINDLAVEVSMCIRSEPQEAVKASAQIQSITNMLISNRENVNSLLTSIEVAAIWFLMEGEDPGIVSSRIQRLKVLHFSGAKEYMGFFLRMANSFLNPLQQLYSDFSQSAIQLMKEAMSLELETMASPNRLASTESGKTKNEPLDFWHLREETLKNSIDYLDSLPTTSTSS